MKKKDFLVLFIFLCSCFLSQILAQGIPVKNIVRIYYIGNSVTDTIQYGKLAEMALSRGYKFEWGRQMIPGAPLSWIYQHPEDGFYEDPYGRYRKALSEFEWNYITLQPFDRQIDEDFKGGEGDLLMSQNFIDLALKKSPNLKIFIYSRWPRMSIEGKAVKFDKDAFDPMKPGSGGLNIEKLDDWEALWLRKYTGGWDGTNETKDYFERLVLLLRKNNPKIAKNINIIPVGDVMLEIDRAMKSGKIKGYKTVWQFYKDGIHMGPNGSYLAACTFFSSITKESPEGLPYELYGVTDAELAKSIQSIVWQVVKNHPLGGL